MNSTLALVLIVLVGAGGIAAGWMLRTARTPAAADHDDSAPYDTLVTAPAPVAVPHGMPVDADRRLINSLIGIHDLDGGTSARERIREDLAQVDVHILDAAPGALFDSAHHKAVSGAVAATPDQVGTIATLVRPGWVGPAGILRFAEVAVYVAPTDPMPL
ncbi:hypothetical protein NOU13_24030 [Rhodococcus erythropolis]|uniref:hypothetical protein n=1 Tax=Rhodococcus erythropolis TaxID=1833 RepID=UPI002108B65C|nr:hypothetical protein [Rhodococcus erythropolis]MCQ4127576.1 hypothetical protein [Rhodococcus erythropolis]